MRGSKPRPTQWQVLGACRRLLRWLFGSVIASPVARVQEVELLFGGSEHQAVTVGKQAQPVGLGAQLLDMHQPSCLLLAMAIIVGVGHLLRKMLFMLFDVCGVPMHKLESNSAYFLRVT